MLPIQQYTYIVRVYSDKDDSEVASENTANAEATLSFKHLNSHTNMTVTFTIGITVTDIHRQRSNATIIKKTINFGMYNITSSKSKSITSFLKGDVRSYSVASYPMILCIYYVVCESTTTYVCSNLCF